MNTSTDKQIIDRIAGGFLNTPLLAIDLNQIAKNYREIAEAFDFAKVFYAIKANPTLSALETLIDEGSCFDAASKREIEDCFYKGASPNRISFGNTIKKSADIAWAHKNDIDIFA